MGSDHQNARAKAAAVATAKAVIRSGGTQAEASAKAKEVAVRVLTGQQYYPAPSPSTSESVDEPKASRGPLGPAKAVLPAPSVTSPPTAASVATGARSTAASSVPATATVSKADTAKKKSSGGGFMRRLRKKTGRVKAAAAAAAAVMAESSAKPAVAAPPPLAAPPSPARDAPASAAATEARDETPRRRDRDGHDGRDGAAGGRREERWEREERRGRRPGPPPQRRRGGATRHSRTHDSDVGTYATVATGEMPSIYIENGEDDDVSVLELEPRGGFLEAVDRVLFPVKGISRSGSVAGVARKKSSSTKSSSLSNKGKAAGGYGVDGDWLALLCCGDYFRTGGGGGGGGGRSRSRSCQGRFFCLPNGDSGAGVSALTAPSSHPARSDNDNADDHSALNDDAALDDGQYYWQSKMGQPRANVTRFTNASGDNARGDHDTSVDSYYSQSKMPRPDSALRVTDDSAGGHDKSSGDPGIIVGAAGVRVNANRQANAAPTTTTPPPNTPAANIPTTPNHKSVSWADSLEDKFDVLNLNPVDDSYDRSLLLATERGAAHGREHWGGDVNPGPLLSPKEVSGVSPKAWPDEEDSTTSSVSSRVKDLLRTPFIKRRGASGSSSNTGGGTGRGGAFTSGRGILQSPFVYQGSPSSGGHPRYGTSDWRETVGGGSMGAHPTDNKPSWRDAVADTVEKKAVPRNDGRDIIAPSVNGSSASAVGLMAGGGSYQQMRPHPIHQSTSPPISPRNGVPSMGPNPGQRPHQMHQQMHFSDAHYAVTANIDPWQQQQQQQQVQQVQQVQLQQNQNDGRLLMQDNYTNLLPDVTARETTPSPPEEFPSLNSNLSEQTMQDLQDKYARMRMMWTGHRGSQPSHSRDQYTDIPVAAAKQHQKLLATDLYAGTQSPRPPAIPETNQQLIGITHDPCGSTEAVMNVTRNRGDGRRSKNANRPLQTSRGSEGRAGYGTHAITWDIPPPASPKDRDQPCATGNDQNVGYVAAQKSHSGTEDRNECGTSSSSSPLKSNSGLGSIVSAIQPPQQLASPLPQSYRSNVAGVARGQRTELNGGPGVATHLPRETPNTQSRSPTNQYSTGQDLSPRLTLPVHQSSTVESVGAARSQEVKPSGGPRVTTPLPRGTPNNAKPQAPADRNSSGGDLNRRSEDLAVGSTSPRMESLSSYIENNRQPQYSQQQHQQQCQEQPCLRLVEQQSNTAFATGKDTCDQKTTPQEDYQQNTEGNSIFQHDHAPTQPFPPENGSHNKSAAAPVLGDNILPSAPQNNNNTRMYSLHPPQQHDLPNHFSHSNNDNVVDSSSKNNSYSSSNRKNATDNAINNNQSLHPCIDPKSADYGTPQATNATIQNGNNNEIVGAGHNDNNITTVFGDNVNPQHRKNPSSAEYSTLQTPTATIAGSNTNTNNNIHKEYMASPLASPITTGMGGAGNPTCSLPYRTFEA